MKFCKICRILLIVILVSICSSAAFGSVKSQWRGPNRNGVYPGQNLLKKWPANGPKLLWSHENIGVGHSSPAVTDKVVYINGMIDETGYLHAFDLQGKLIWKANYGAEWDESYPGARSTPTIVSGKIYFSNALTQIICIDAANGKLLWSRNMIEDFNAENLRWGITESLLINGDKLYCTPGGNNHFMAVLNRYTGESLNTIQAAGKKSAYCSPVLISHNGRDLIFTMSSNTLVCIDAKTEKVLWQKQHETRYDINPNTPIYNNGNVYVVSGYGTTGSQMFKLNNDGTASDLLWHEETLDSQFGGTVIIDGFIYGSGHKNKGWHCLESSTGRVMYSSTELGKKGNIIYADGLLYCYDESGQVGLVKPDPNKFQLISKFEVTKGSGQHWAHPVIANGRLFVRHGEALMVYDIRQK